jgi:hypothetical protein
LIFSARYLAFHLGDHGQLSGFDLGVSRTSLAAGVLAPVALLLMSGRRSA